ncbi:hypothetical protein SAY87_026974 [Trapa incisa]|uniref:Transcription repressor n=1 Tax=Trapa incisa TaxID=236973 RepID=A0AAN7GMM4_9MYRT|nr:hypothetical protein SAY87_026974 [Trapa incisa]
MGNYRFKLLDMIPSSWLRKLRDMGKPSVSHGTEVEEKMETETGQQEKAPVPRDSYRLTRGLQQSSSVSPSDLKLSEARCLPTTIPPRRSTRHRRANPRKSRKVRPPRVVSSTVSAGCNCRATLDSVWAKTEPHALPETESSEFPSSDTDSSSTIITVEKPPPSPQSYDDQTVLGTTSCSCRVNSRLDDIVIDVKETSLFEPLEVKLPPVTTKPSNFADARRPEEAGRSLSVKAVKESPARGFAVNSPGTRMRLRLSSSTPRTGPRQRAQQGGGQRRRSAGLSESYAVVKSSADPRREFRESMVEMIRENNIRASKDLEDLLACYLSLNSDEYHGVIISVFKQIWFDLNGVH